MAETDTDAVATGGVATLLAQPEFADPRLVGPLLQLLEDGLDDAAGAHRGQPTRARSSSASGPRTRRGSTGSRWWPPPTTRGGTDGVVGVIGPTRMDYARAVSAVRTVADGLSETFG